jgi:hypothetical protein
MASSIFFNLCSKRLAPFPKSGNAMLNRMTEDTRPQDGYDERDQRALVRYVALSAALFVPLLLAFVAIRNLYPFAASTMMLGIRDTESARDYYVLRGETISGETIDLPAFQLTNALSGRNWSLVSTAVENKSFNIRSPHPANVRLAVAFGGADKLPGAARLEDLLRAWGAIYNSRLPTSSNQRLTSLRVDKYRWEGRINGQYDRFVESWRTGL